jgi:hypothetical protein
MNACTDKISGDQTGSSPRISYLTFNLKVFFVLLGILVSEFADLEEAAFHADGTTRDSSETLTPAVRRVLPALRHYSSWLRSSSPTLDKQTDEAVIVHARELWKRYAEALTVLTTTFDIAGLPSVDYLLEEDLDTLNFTPLTSGIAGDRYREDGHVKPKIGDTGVQRLHPSQEMLARVRGLVLDGIQIVMGDVSCFSGFFWYESLTKRPQLGDKVRTGHTSGPEEQPLRVPRSPCCC